MRKRRYTKGSIAVAAAAALATLSRAPGTGAAIAPAAAPEGSSTAHYGPPPFPPQFSATITTVAHLVDPAQQHPPAIGRMRVRYDSVAGLALARIEAGVEVGRTYVRRYDQKREYMVSEGEVSLCRRSYLGDPMPAPELPQEAVLQGNVYIQGGLHQHWGSDLGDSVVHLYIDLARNVPRRVVQELKNGAGEPTPLMTYEISDLVLGPQDPIHFEVPAPFSHDTCEFYVGGFPYVHAFHHYLRF